MDGPPMVMAGLYMGIPVKRRYRSSEKQSDVTEKLMPVLFGMNELTHNQDMRVVMPEQKKPKDDKKLSLHPLPFEEALKGLLETEPPKEKQEKKKTPTKRRQRNTSKKTEQ
jgi:hypothetical protein